MPSFGLSGEEVYSTCADSTIFYSGADSIQSIRHLNSAREVQRLQQIAIKDRSIRRRSAEIIALDFDAKLANHRAKFSPKARDVSILERSFNAVTISAFDAPKQATTFNSEIRSDNASERTNNNPIDAMKFIPQSVSKPQLISSTPLPVSKQNFSFSNPSTSVLSPIPNIDKIPRFRDSLATPIFKGTESVNSVTAIPLVKISPNPAARSLHDTLIISRLGSVEEEKIEIMKEMIDDGRQPTSTSVTPSSTRPSSPVDGEPSINETDRIVTDSSSSCEGEWSLSNVYYSDIMIELKSYLDDARMFVARSGITRSLIKRSVIEKLTVTSKRHATNAENESTCTFFARLLSMEDVDGFNNEKFRLREKTSVHYAMTLIVDNYLSLLERDYPLADTISYVLYSLSTRCPSFSIFLTASLLSRSPFLDMHKSKCRVLVDGILTDPQSHLDVIARERAVCCLFYGIHSWSSKNPIQNSPFPLSSIWRILACTLNRAPILLATPFTLTELIKTCGAELKLRYGRQMEKLTGVIEDKLLPQLERDLEINLESRRAGNAAYISTLRSTIDLLNIS
ncbi:hypothetical protein PRIPAC_81390 [Pristionchus pacificus]|uniref:GLE1 RNA export mediator n=1 Tax=Pristionchus pacificus TaxID=54126 RepID=A0A2A6C338_PRIPA|nr:hypothetical protein PRIPAC_81390 [Pristionchus pacificus]|eukprot:PDM72441.1 hypothetical protein PRIPAC_38875 [Pristionchus pacificus]